MIVYVIGMKEYGGIVQFAKTMLLRTLESTEAILFLPDTIKINDLNQVENHVKYYKRARTINLFSKKITSVVTDILSFHPEKVVFLDDSLILQQINYWLVRKKVKTAITIHDINVHPYHDKKLRTIIVETLQELWRKKTIRQNNSIILLSNNSKNLFKKKYFTANSKIVVMRLGAHVPIVESISPQEITNIQDYFLFFGRIDKYKGIEQLCTAYCRLEEQIKEKHKLIIAGNGKFSEDEKKIISKEENIITIHRFIEDSEMVWLYQHACGVILPYIEASQSGVLPIAYHFGKPVIVSEQPGLLENVLLNKTGYSYHSLADFTNTLKELSKHLLLEDDIKEYYEQTMDWDKNIKNMLKEV